MADRTPAGPRSPAYGRADPTRPEPRTDWAETFARARDADIEAVAGVKLFRSGRRMRGPCPLCGASQGKRADGAFSVDPQARVFKCWACGEGGDVVDLERLVRGGTLREAAVRLCGMPVQALTLRREAPSTGSRSPSPSGGGSRAERLALDMWNGASEAPIAQTPAARYLAGRGLAPGFHGAGWHLRYSPRAVWGWSDEQQQWITTPAIIARVVGPGGFTGGFHVTYLSADGATKSRWTPAKRMWGPQKDHDGRPGGVWLSAPDGPGPLVVGEGIESTLSAMQLLGRPCRGVATLSLGALQGGWLRDRFGRVDVAQVQPDPDQPAFTWPVAPGTEVLIAVDRDMGPIEVKVRKPGGGTARHRLTPEERARICAGLAVAAWKVAGANVVRVIAPAAGRDFNDELMSRVGV